MTQEINYDELRKLTEALEAKEFNESDCVKKLLLLLSQTTTILQSNTKTINYLINDVEELKEELKDLRKNENIN